MPTERDIHQHVEPAEASDRVAEKAKIVTERLALIDKQNAAERKLFPPAPIKTAK